MISIHASIRFPLALVLCLFAFACGEEAPEEGSCAEGELLCGGSCVDPRYDAGHCGACGQACEEGSICLDGACKAPCDEGLHRCGDRCVDLLQDASHCGTCETACAEGESCVEGRCEVRCEEGRTFCDGACVDLQGDPEHCGSCSKACADGRSCVEGSCACPSDRMDCNGTCVKQGSDPENCGACGKVCAPGEVCSSGTCALECETWFVACGASCVDPESDAEHCGGCDRPCGSGMVCELGECACPGEQLRCDDRCIDVSSDDQNCGDCGVVCEGGKVCQDGACGCPEGMEECDGVCVDTQSDPAHCGACTMDCSVGDNVLASSTCEAGACRYECAPGWADCTPIRGCETPTDANLLHCGACNVACLPGELCAEGSCTCPEGSQVCGLACIDVRDDFTNCGACGVTCRLDQVCGDSSCQCPPGRSECDETCVDLSSDKTNCGECGVTCRGDQVCSDEGCVCPAGREECGGACVNTQSDAKNCGGCGEVCDPGRVCSGGTCACPSYLNECDGVCVDFNSRETCGSCDNACRPDQACNDQRCGCEKGQVECDGACVPAGECGGGGDCPHCPFGCDEKGGCAGVVDFAGGRAHSCVLTSEQEVWCWGDNTYGQLGDGAGGKGETRLLPVKAVGLQGVQRIALGDDHSCALLQDGTVSCWGRGDNGRIGNEENDRHLPAKVEGMSSKEPAISLAAGGAHTCVATGDHAYCWGHNHAGQVGNGTSEAEPSPRRVEAGKAGPLEGVIEVALSNANSCALLKDSTVWCWGEGKAGENGDDGNSNTDGGPPVQVLIGKGPLDDVVAIAGGCGPLAGRQCAVGSKEATCWGNNDEGALGDGNPGNDAPFATRILAEDVQQLITADRHGCALLHDGRVQCWGSQEEGRLGNGQNKGANSSPEDVLDAGCKDKLEEVTRIGRGHAHTCAITKSGELKCWGSNGDSQLGGLPKENLCATPFP